MKEFLKQVKYQFIWLTVWLTDPGFRERVRFNRATIRTLRRARIKAERQKSTNNQP